MVEITNDGKVVREVTIDVNKEYKVSPYKEIKVKHRDSAGAVKSFKKIEDKSELKVHLQFSNNNNFDWVDAQDLVSL